jgi:flavorubredoxin
MRLNRNKKGELVMMITEIANDTHQLTMNVENILFEGIWEIPNGVSLNSYIIQGEKTAIIDGVCGWDGVPESLLELLSQIKVEPSSVEYLIVNHTEPDHSGWLEAFKKLNKEVKIVCSKKAKDLLDAFYGEMDNVIVVKDLDTLDLGQGHLLQFAEIPNVHWPDTIATLDTLTGTLFSCDAFGSFGNVTSSVYADMLSEEELKAYEVDTIRYYSNILATFSPQVKKAVAKCETLPIKMIAPGHGLIFREPAKIMKAYCDYADYQKGPARKELTLLWGSMYGMTAKAVNYAVELLQKEDIIVHVHQVPEASWGTVLTSVWTSSAIILAMPTYEFKMFPPMASAIEELGKKKVYNRKAFRFGSYGWSGGAQKELDEIMTRLAMNWEFIEQVEFVGTPKEEDLKLIGERIKELTKYIKDL